MGLIKKMILLLTAGVFLPLTALAIHISLFEYNSTKDLHYNSAKSVTVRANIAISDYLNSTVSPMFNQRKNHIFSEYIFDPAAAPELQRELENTISDSIYIYNSILLDSSGNFILSTQPIGDFKPDENTIKISENDKKPTADFHFTQIDDKCVIPVYVPILSQDDRAVGFIVNFLDTKYLSLIMQSLYFDDQSDCIIIDSNNNVLASSGGMTSVSQLSTISSRSLSAVFQNTAVWGTADAYQFSFDSHEGDAREAVLQKNKDYGFCLVFTFPSEYVAISTYKIICIIFLYMLAIAAVIICLYFIFKRDFQKPFNEIFKTIQIYELGDWTYRPTVENDNELSMIADALWHMAEKMNYMYIDIKFNEYRYKLSLEFSSDIIYDIDLTKNVVDSSADKWESFFGNKKGTTEKQVFGSLINAIHPEDKELYKNYRSSLLHECYDGIEKQCTLEFRILLKDGDYHWVLKKDILVKGATDNIEHIVGSIIIIDETKNNELKARIDSLTGLYNRAEFISRLNKMFSMKNHTEGAVIFFDIDDFKHINDNYGHDVGDDVLKFVGKSIIETIEQTGIGGRYGGDELLAYVYSKDRAAGVAQTILEKLSKNFIVRGSFESIKIKSSIGIAYYPDHETDAERLIKKADSAMYHAKKNGKNQYRIYTPGDEQTE